MRCAGTAARCAHAISGNRRVAAAAIPIRPANALLVSIVSSSWVLTDMITLSDASMARNGKSRGLPAY